MKKQVQTKTIFEKPPIIISFPFFINYILIGTAGWLLECFVYYLQCGRFYDCGFLISPFCPIYSVGLFLVLIFFDYYTRRYANHMRSIRHKRGKLRKFIDLFFVSALAATLLEAFSGILFDMFNLTLWNYSSWPLSIKYISLPASIGWGFGGALYVLYVFPAISRRCEQITRRSRIIIAASFFTLLLIDYLITFILILKRGGYAPLY